MKTVLFKRLQLQNFLSIGSDTITIDFQKGLHVITGVNLDKPDRKNAIGKTTIVNGFYWCIFGTTIEGLKKDLIANNVVGGTACGVLTFDIVTPSGTKQYEIIRKINPSSLSLIVDGVDKTRDSIANTNDLIADVLSASQELFKNCVVMTINNTTPFMAKNKVEKRKFIEDIFGLEIFSSMVQTVRAQANEMSKQYDIEKSKYDELTISIKKLEDQRSNLLKTKQEKLELYLKRQRENDTLLESYVNDLKTIQVEKSSELDDKKESIIAGVEQIENSINDITSKIATLNSNKSHRTNELNQIGTDKDVCSKCLRSITDHDHNHISTEKEKIKKDIEKIQEEIEAQNKVKVSLGLKKQRLGTALKQIDGKITNNRLLIQKKRDIEDKIKQVKTWQETLVDDIKESQDGKTDFDSTIQEISERITDFESKCVALKKNINRLDIAKFILSEEGVKSYIVKILLDQLNSKLLYYLRKLDSNCICYFDEFFEEEILNERKKLCSYFNFSGAEKKAIDIACMFAFSDIKRQQGGVNYNVSFYDELFDTSFDEKGIELIVDVLKERISKYNEGCYIVSHRKESTKNVTGEIIHLEKKSDITRRVEQPESFYT